MFRSAYILFFFCLGFFLMPNKMYACKMEAASTHKVDSKAATSKKDDCEHKKSEENHCGNDCSNTLCKCPTNSNISFFYSNSFSFTKVKVNVSHSFLNDETNISKGFYSIWLIPKIG